MKSLYPCFLSALLALMIIACEGKDDSYPPIIYGYNLAFVDEQDNDLIEGIVTYSDPSKRLILRENDYSYKLVKPSSKDDFTAPRYIYVSSVNEYNVLEIFEMLWEGYRYDKKPDVLTRTFVCPYIFGDEKEHSIVSNWKYADGSGSAELIRISIDGVEGQIVDNSDLQAPLVIITLKK